jgi:hypothetical protein
MENGLEKTLDEWSKIKDGWQAQETAAQDLIALVTSFNQSLAEWSQKTGCVANFGWRYSVDKQPKALEILGVDKILYRKPPPTLETMVAAMEQKKV